MRVSLLRLELRRCNTSKSRALQKSSVSAEAALYTESSGGDSGEGLWNSESFEGTLSTTATTTKQSGSRCHAENLR